MPFNSGGERLVQVGSVVVKCSNASGKALKKKPSARDAGRAARFRTLSDLLSLSSFSKVRSWVISSGVSGSFVSTFLLIVRSCFF